MHPKRFEIQLETFIPILHVLLSQKLSEKKMVPTELYVFTVPAERQKVIQNK